MGNKVLAILFCIGNGMAHTFTRRYWYWYW